jgi:C-terminal processing protease CtpA/Prc
LNDSHTYAYRPVRRPAHTPADERYRRSTRHEVNEVKVLADGVVYVRFDYFDRERVKWLVREVSAHRDAPGMILDLRHNNGGLIVSAQRAVGLFFRERVSMGVVGQRNGRRSTEHSRGSGRYFGPLAVLVGSGSHSSAEVFAYVMQAHERAVVVGQVTAGEVLGSRRFPLPDGGQLQLSVSDYHCLDGQRLEGRGVEPDVLTPVLAGNAADDLADATLASAMQILRPGTSVARR